MNLLNAMTRSLERGRERGREKERAIQLLNIRTLQARAIEPCYHILPFILRINLLLKEAYLFH